MWPRPPTEQALMRSQSGPMAGLPLSRTPWSNLFVFTPGVFRVLLLRRLWLPLPPASRNCRCGRPLDVLGHDRAACSRAGVLASRGSSLKFAAAQVCREAGGRSMNVFISNLDLPAARIDSRRLEWTSPVWESPTRGGHHVGTSNKSGMTTPPKVCRT